jgi:hypothetical protein
VLRDLADAIDFRLLHAVHTGSETHPDSSSMGVGDLPVEKKSQGVRLTTYFIQ